MSDGRPCPDPLRLRQLLADQLEPWAVAELSAHLEDCPHCPGTLESLLAASGSWTEILLGLPVEEPPPEPGLSRILEAARSTENPAVTDAGSAGAGQDDELTFLAAPQTPGHLGRLGHYEIVEVLGRGGFGIVLKAFDTKLHRVVALKVLAPALAVSATARKRFTREARAVAAVAHEHVVTVYAVEDDADPPYLVMECILGVSLQDRLNSEGALGVQDILRIALQIARGLEAAHAQGLVHRDVKPGNILLEDGTGCVKISDFGLARAVDDATLTQSGVVAGTPLYMSPEQANGLPVDGRSDLFSLGTVLYAMCTGTLPFRAVGTMAVLRQVVDDTPPSVCALRGELPAWLGDLIVRLHAKQPEHRYQSAQEVADLLSRRLTELHWHEQTGIQEAVRHFPGPTNGGSPMPYTAAIDRTNPTCFLFLIDQSASMLEPFGRQPEKQKAEGVTDALNGFLQNLAIRCAKSEGIVDYFYVGVFGYGGPVKSALGGPLAGEALVPISVLASNPLRVEQRTRQIKDKAGNVSEKKVKAPVWVEARSGGRTPMCQALAMARQALEVFLGRFPGCYPPLVLNITDGESTDGDPSPAAKNLCSLTSTDGNVLLFNAHLSDKAATPVEFPPADTGLPDDFAKRLFRMSSLLPLPVLEMARRERGAVPSGARGFVFNGDLKSVIQFLDVGTKVGPGAR